MIYERSSKLGDNKHFEILEEFTTLKAYKLKMRMEMGFGWDAIKLSKMAYLYKTEIDKQCNNTCNEWGV